MKKPKHVPDAEKVSQGRHKAACTICNHPQREEIERDFLEWRSPVRIAVEYALAARSTIYLHARAFGLMAKRERNIRAALVRIIEKAEDVEASAPSVVAAVQAFAKINAQGHWIERTEHVNLNELFDRMSKQELEEYATEGKLPAWFTQTVSATATDSQGDDNAA